MKILMLAAELTPIVKAGGLGDVVGALPKALSLLGQEVVIMIPLYGMIDKQQFKLKKLGFNIDCFFSGESEKFTLWQAFLPKTKIKVYFIDHRFFEPESIYLGSRIDLENSTYSRNFTDIERFAFFSSAALAAIKTLSWQPDVIHCHDWHSGLVPDIIRGNYANDEFFSKTKLLYTVHNLANQGSADPKILAKIGLEADKYSLKAGERVNFMARGIASAHLVNTVSSQYAKEILTKEYGAGLEKLLKKRKNDLFGVVNGIDVDFFDPAKDQHVPFKYSVETLANKNKNKAVLQERFGLPKKPEVAIIGLVSRLVNQKGLDLITEKLAKLNAQFVFLGTGQPEVEKILTDLSVRYPDKFAVKIGFDADLAQLIYAGSDFFLMPSRFEPCGLGQLIAMRYGTLPIVRMTGGLADTVDEKVGFSFYSYRAEALHKTIKEGLTVFYAQPKKYVAMQKTAMKRDFSWKKSAQTYINIYKKLAKIK